MIFQIVFDVVSEYIHAVHDVYDVIWCDMIQGVTSCEEPENGEWLKKERNKFRDYKGILL